MNAAKPNALGPVMLDVAGTALTDEDRRRLLHPLTGGVILFARNYASPAQIAAMTAEIHALRDPPLLVAVDHEGGRVQRFREGFTALPPMRALGAVWDHDPKRAGQLAFDTGTVLATELRACGVDFSFAPVLDLDYGASGVIGDRAFHAKPEAISELAGRLVAGMRRAGMAAVGKHFPGHGYVRADSHHEIPVDERTLADIEAADLKPFESLSAAGMAGVMPAHVIYPQVDARPAGFSPVWLKEILRGRLGFAGTVFSDDLSMEGASVAGDVTARAHAALDAGCDMVLVCNQPASADQLLAELKDGLPAVSLARLARMHGHGGRPEGDAQYRTALAAVRMMDQRPGELPLVRS
ncbi:MAG: beta-N-acetylhexosaminidase [Burkholderiales bacterium]